MAAKHQAGRHQLVQEMLDLMWRHLLGHLGVEEVPASIEDAAPAYLRARTLAEERFKRPFRWLFKPTSSRHSADSAIEFDGGQLIAPTSRSVKASARSATVRVTWTR